MFFELIQLQGSFLCVCVCGAGGVVKGAVFKIILHDLFVAKAVTFGAVELGYWPSSAWSLAEVFLCLFTRVT